MRGKRKLVGLFVVGVGALALWGPRGAAPGTRSPASSPGEVAASVASGAKVSAATRGEVGAPSEEQVARVAALKDAVRQQLNNLRRGTPAPAAETAPAPSAPRLGLGPEDLAPVPLAERPSESDLALFDKASAEERARAARPEPPDPDLLVGLLAAVEQATENPALRSAIANSYLDAVRGLDEPEATEARQKLEQVYRPSRVR